MLSLFKRKPRLPRAAVATGNPQFALQAVEPRLLLSADPITGIFEDNLNSELAPEVNIAQATDELAEALNKYSDSEQKTALADDDKANFESYVKPYREQGLLISTADDVATNPGQAGGSDGWSGSDAIAATNITFSSSGADNALFEEEFLLSHFGSDADFNAIHFVSQEVVVNGYILEAGDILFSVNNNADLASSDGSSLRAQRGDIMLFRPDLVGDYSSGYFYEIYNKISGGNTNVQALTLVEESTTVGGVNLYAGNLIYVLDGDSEIKLRQETLLGLAVSTSALVSDNASGDDDDSSSAVGDALATSGITAVELIETEQTIGNVTYAAGTLLVASDDENGLVALDFSGGGSSLEYADATATLAWDYDDILYGATGIDALSVAPIVTYINVEPTGSVTISGDATEDQTLTAQSTLADEDGLGSFTYQWFRDGVAVAGATSDSYTLADADVGSQMTVRISYTDGYGTEEQVTSAATDVVANVNDEPYGTLYYDGDLIEDETITLDVSDIRDDDGFDPATNSVQYQWFRDNVAISGATAESYTLGDDDVGTIISFTIEYQDDQGTVETLGYRATAAVANVNDEPTGSVTIGGDAEEYSTLSAITSSIADADGLGTFGYQWLRNGEAISGATQASYTLSSTDIGETISVRVNYLDGYGTAETLTSANTGAVANVNDAPTGVVDLLGSSIAGQTLTMDLSELADIDGLGSFSYQWLRNGEIIDGATGVGYVLTSSDIGAVVQGQVLYTDGHGTLETVTSQASEHVADNIGHGTATVTIAGSAAEYETLTALASLLDEDGSEEEPSAIRYQWFRDDIVIDGAVDSTYQLTQADIGGRFSVLVELDHHHIDASSVLSDATAVVINTNDLPQGQLIISGLAQEYQTLEVSTSGITDGDGLGDFNRQWLRNGVAIAGATGTQYTLTADDIGSSLSVQITYRDGYGTAERVVSLATDEVANVNDPLLGELAIAGQMIEGQNLNAVTDTLADADGLGDLQYQWLRNGQAIEGATGNNYRLGQDDVGSNIALRVQYTDGFGTVESVSAAGTSAVQNINDDADGAVVIRGNNLVGESLTADTSNVSDRDGLGSFQYQWLRDGEVIAGATEQDYRLLQSDLDAEISVQVTYVDGFGQQEQVGSNKVVVEVLRLEAEAIVEVNEPEPATKAPEQVVEAEPEADSGQAEEESSTEQVDGNGQQTTSVKMDVSASVAAVESIQGVDFTNSALSGLATNFGDSTNTDADAGDGGGNLLKNDSLLAESLGIELASETVANLDQFLDPLELVTNVAVNDSFDQLRQQFMDMTGQEQMLWSGGTTTLTASFSVGYVVWLLRSGVLLSTALSAIPAWRFIDPLPVLMSSASAAGDGDDESLESMVSQGAAEQDAGAESNDKESH